MLKSPDSHRGFFVFCHFDRSDPPEAEHAVEKSQMGES